MSWVHDCKISNCDFSKFDFLKEVAEENPYDTNYFIWLDAGTFSQPPPFDVTLSWPDPYKMLTIGNKFLIPNIKMNLTNKVIITDRRSYLRTNPNEIIAFMLGGTYYW